MATAMNVATAASERSRAACHAAQRVAARASVRQPRADADQRARRQKARRRAGIRAWQGAGSNASTIAPPAASAATKVSRQPRDRALSGRALGQDAAHARDPPFQEEQQAGRCADQYASEDCRRHHGG